MTKHDQTSTGLRLSRNVTTLLVALIAGAIALLTALASPASAAAQVNASGMSPNSATAASVIKSNEKAAFNYFVAKKLTAKQAAGIVGNLDQESGMDPTIKQYGGGPGRGIAQWSVGGRWDHDTNDNNIAYAKTLKLSATSLTEQLDFVWYELTKYSGYGLSHLKASTTVDSAVIAFQNYYEGCGTCDSSARESFANAAYKAYA